MSVSSAAMRRSSRLRWQMPLRVTSLEQQIAFDEICETLVVNAHGCGLRSRRELAPNACVQLETPDQRRATGFVVSSTPLGNNSQGFLIGIDLHNPGNFWGVPNPPDDWAALVQPTPATSAPGADGAATGTANVDKVASPQFDDWQRWRQERAAVELNLHQFVQFLDGFQRRWTSAAEPLRDLVPLRDQAIEQTRQELQTLVRAAQEKLVREGAAREALAAAMDSVRAEMERFQESARALQLQFEKVSQAREDVEALARAMPQRVAQHVSQSAAAAFQQWQKQAEAELAGRVRREILQCVEHHLPELAQEAGTNYRQQLIAEWEQHRQELARAAHTLGSDLEARAGEALDSLQWQLQAVFDACQDKFESKHAAAEERLEALEKRAGDLVAHVDTTLQAHAEESIRQTVDRAREELGRVCGTIQESYLAQSQGELHRVLAEVVRQAGESADELRRTLQSLQVESQQNQAASSEVTRQLQQAQAWLAQETGQFRKTVHDSFVQAKAEIQGHIQQALETAEAPLAHRGREVQAQLDDLARRHMQELSRHSDEARHRLRAVHEDTQAAAEKALQARLTETTETFRQNAHRLVETTLEQWQSALSQSFAAIRQVMAAQLGQTP